MDSLLGKFRKRSLSHNSTSHSGALGSTKGGGGGDSRTKLLLEDQQELAGLIAAMRVQDGQLVELHTSLQGFLDTLRGACDHLGELTTTFKGLFKESGVSRAAVFGERWITLGHVMHGFVLCYVSQMCTHRVCCCGGPVLALQTLLSFRAGLLYLHRRLLCLCSSICLFVSVTLTLSVCVSLTLSVSLSLCLSVSLSRCLFLCLSGRSPSPNHR